MSSFWSKARDLFTPHSQSKEAKSTTRIQDPVCIKCRGGKCSFLTEFILFDPHLSDRNRGTNTRFSMWQCPTCGQYYRREWITAWRSGSLAPAPNQYILTYAVDERPARRILDMIKKCPDPMTREPECCNCDLHSTLELGFGSVPLPMVVTPTDEEDELVDRVDFPLGAHDYLLEGVERYQEQYYRRRQPCG